MAKSTTWTNWGGNQIAVPAAIERPTTEAGVAAIVQRAAGAGQRVKVVGSGHSFTDICVTDGVLVDVGQLNRIESVDTDTKRVTVGAGVVLHDLNEQLWARGLALPNLGDIDVQTLGGATGTGTHGTGVGYQAISTAIVGARIVVGDGSIVECSESHRPDLLDAVRVSLGALGIVTSFTLQCEPAFNLHALETTEPIDEVLEKFLEVASENEHAEFFWFPHTDVAELKVNNRTDRPVKERSKWKSFMAEEVMTNGAFEVLNRIGRARPERIPQMLQGAIEMGRRASYVGRSFDVFCSKRRVRFVEMEYAVNRHHIIEIFGRVRSLIDTLGQPISFPIEVRVLGPDTMPLSMASERDSAFIAVHVFKGTPHEAYFGAVESIVREYGGRPHWGKLHRQSAATLAPLYPHWDQFEKARLELDPDRRFTNAYLNRVLHGDGPQ